MRVSKSFSSFPDIVMKFEVVSRCEVPNYPDLGEMIIAAQFSLHLTESNIPPAAAEEIEPLQWRAG